MKFPPLTLKHLTIDPPVFLAPMAGITNSAFRRLVADFGGYGALFTEMLSGKALIHEKVGETSFTKKRSVEGIVWYQLALCGDEDLACVVDKLRIVSPDALDINAACPAPEMHLRGFGAGLFRDAVHLEHVVKSVRSLWNGILTVKCRLGADEPSWKETFTDRMKLFADLGVDAVTVHPRFFSEKLKRVARWELFDWVCAQTPLPIIANGDIVSPEALSAHKDLFSAVRGIMIGRIAIVKPWIFREFKKGPAPIDYEEVWKTYYQYVLEDFAKEKALGRIKEFTKYYARNFFFGHELASSAQGAQTLEIVYERATAFLSKHPTVSPNPAVAGL